MVSDWRAALNISNLWPPIISLVSCSLAVPAPLQVMLAPFHTDADLTDSAVVPLGVHTYLLQ